ncbi:MAG: leucine-rich repeat domain-containing protein [Lachnospiraceae bacterium]|nr:leucine-rich repeat domain-containing protein [Lachnospiraceae bacterium]
MNEFDYNRFKITDRCIEKADPDLSGDIIIPEGIECIRADAFSKNHNITSVSFPKSIRRIEECAFACCIKIQKIIFPDSLPELTLGPYVFCGGDSLVYINLPKGLTVIPKCAFTGCEKLSSLKIPSDVTEIQLFAFSQTLMEKEYMESGDDCFYVDNWLIKIRQKHIKELNIREGTVGVAVWASHHDRYGSNQIDIVRLPSSLKYLNWGALHYTAQYELDLNSVEYIANFALEHCRIKTLHIPPTCQYFGLENLGMGCHFDHVYFHNDSTLIDDSRESFGNEHPITIHGYKWSTAYYLCQNLGEKYSLTFEEIER